MNTYTTNQVAGIIGIHPNTVRQYEELGLVAKPERLANNYRVFTQLHILQFRLARTALQVEVLQNGLRKQAVAIIKTAARGEYSKALQLVKEYRQHILVEQRNAEEAIAITRKALCGIAPPKDNQTHTRQETADLLGVKIDTLRNWELNGLFAAKRTRNGYRVYGSSDIRLLKIIRTLRCANYSLSAILRLLQALTQNPASDLRQVIDTPPTDDDIISVCDHLLTSLQQADTNAGRMHTLLLEMNSFQKSNPPL